MSALWQQMLFWVPFDSFRPYMAKQYMMQTDNNTKRVTFDDFFQQIDYFTAGDYPAIVCFFADGVDYEIIYVPVGQEYIISKSISPCDNPPKRLVTIENTDQIPKISIPNITAYCITEPSGKTNYYKRKEE